MRKLKRFIPFYIMMIPGLTYLFINNYIPLTGLQLAFKKFKYNEGIFNSPWVGMKNFSFLFKTNDAWVLFRNTLGYNLLFLVINTVLAIAVAILLNEVRSVFVRKMSQTVVLIPFLLSYVVISYIVYALLGQSGGGTMNSCNPVFITVGLRLGVENYYHYFKQFGLMEKTGVDLPGEAGTIMHKMEDMKAVELATVSFGQSILELAV